MDLRFGRPTGPVDWQAIRRICCLTAYGGRGIDSIRQPFFAEYWIGPYEKLLPGWTYSAYDGQGLVGYLTGCPSTSSFAPKRLLLHRLPLAIRLLAGGYPGTQDTTSFLRRLFLLERSPERRFPLPVLSLILRDYPAHLHVNVLAEHRGKGIGARLIEHFLSDLRSQGTPGVHLFCGEEPAGFYRRSGFQELSRIHSAAGGPVYAFVRRSSP